MTKVCTKCHRVSPATAEHFYRNRTRPDGLSHQCKQCMLAASGEYYKTGNGKETQKRYRESRKGQSTIEKYRHSANGAKSHKKACLKIRYGITPSQHLLMYADQNGCCAICKQAVPYDKIVVDHDHEAGKVRGLLCYGCNTWLAAVEDAKYLQAALAYLQENA